jgi:hypothetical protein
MLQSVAITMNLCSYKFWVWKKKTIDSNIDDRSYSHMRTEDGRKEQEITDTDVRNNKIHVKMNG